MRNKSLQSPLRRALALTAALLLLLGTAVPAEAGASEGLSVCAPEGVTVCLSGEALNPDQAERKLDPLLTGLENTIDPESAQCLVWTLPAGTDSSVVTAVTADGQALSPILCTEEAVRFSLPGDEALQGEHEARVREWFNWYSLYGANAYNANLYYALLSCTLQDTSLYDYILYSSDAMVWACGTRLENEEVSVSHFVPRGERCFTCLVHQTATCNAASWYESFSYEIDNWYELAFVFEGWNWYAAAMARLPVGIGSAEDPDPGLHRLPVSDGRVKGTLLIVDDPTRVILGTSDNLGHEAGLQLPALVEKYGGVAGINAGGFNDENGRGSGGIPQGLVIAGGEIRWGSAESSYQVVGLDRDGVLRVGTMTGAEALSRGIQSAVSFVTFDGVGSALIVDGALQAHNLARGVNPRTAIGQRADGALLLLVLEGRSVDALGATTADVARVMLRYGAVTAGNLDGGSSSVMVCGGDIVNFCSSVTGPRYIPTGFIVLPEGESHA